MTELSGNLWFTTLFSIIFKITDKRIAGIHITMLASLTNQCQFIHKFYIFELVDRFGIFMPQAAIALISLVSCVLMQAKIRDLDDVPVQAWHVSPEVLGLKAASTSSVEAQDKEKKKM